MLKNFALVLALLGLGACASGEDGICGSNLPASTTSVTVEGETWVDDASSNGDDEEEVFIAARSATGENSLSMLVRRVPEGTYALGDVARQFSFGRGGTFYSTLVSGQLVVTRSVPGTVDRCNGRFDFDFSFSASDSDELEVITATGRSVVANILGSVTAVEPLPTGGGGGGLARCTDGAGVCSQLNSGSVQAFQGECADAGNAFAASGCSPGTYRCTGGTGTSGGSSVGIDIHWPGGICARAEYADKLYLEGTCVNILGGSYSGDADSCCSGATAPVPGGTACQ